MTEDKNTFEHIDYNGREIYDEIVSCQFCGKDLGYFNGNWVDGAILGVCMECRKKFKP